MALPWEKMKALSGFRSGLHLLMFYSRRSLRPLLLRSLQIRITGDRKHPGTDSTGLPGDAPRLPRLVRRDFAPSVPARILCALRFILPPVSSGSGVLLGQELWDWEMPQDYGPR